MIRKNWYFFRPKPDKVMRFENTGHAFSALSQAGCWLCANGYRFGSGCCTSPYIPAVKGECYKLPQKLCDFDIEDYLKVNAVIYSSDFRDGNVEVWFVEPMYCLDLVVKYKWYDMIESGVKTEEYRDIHKWAKRIVGKPFTHVRFHRGYTAKVMYKRIDNIIAGTGNPAWGAVQGVRYLVIKFAKDNND